MRFRNTYEDARYAAAYAGLEFAGTYRLAFRDLPEIIGRHVHGRRALDFDCGAGRSTRFVRRLGFDVIGVDISPEMIRLASTADPSGDYRLVPDDGAVSPVAIGVERRAIDLVLCAFPFDNIPTLEKKAALLDGLGSLLAEQGRIVNIVSSPEIYTHEWASFSTRPFPENRAAQPGDIVRILNLAVDPEVPAEDVLWTPAAWDDTWRRANLSLVSAYQPLARPDDPGPWVNETRVAPWTIHVLQRTGSGGHRLGQ
jgi:SAM-dependent methyltransferase